MSVNACAVHSSLLGRWARGSWCSENPSYVRYIERFTKRGKLRDDLPEGFDEPVIWHAVTEPVVAVSMDTTHTGAPWTKIWVLIDGRPTWLDTGTVVMPAGWTPSLR